MNDRCKTCPARRIADHERYAWIGIPELRGRIWDLEEIVDRLHKLWRKERELRRRSEDFRDYDGTIRNLAFDLEIQQELLVSALATDAVQSALVKEAMRISGGEVAHRLNNQGPVWE